ncbi:MAG TPA: hypothetical protein VK203_10630 [Nostocaceae cyanobacterium]|nr:hypothetical protein [Nostocaceae cyanobacterium]
MNLLKKLIHSAKFWAVTFSCLSFLTFCFPATATAGTKLLVDQIQECAFINGGSFSVDKTGDVPLTTVITSAILSLPANETGIIESIVITGPDGQREFGCENIKVKNGTDLIKACGGNAFLKAGKTNYKAKGSNFQPILDTVFSVNLS